MQLLVVIYAHRHYSNNSLGGSMKRKPMSRRSSRKVFKKNTGIHKLNSVNRNIMRGGIRL